MNYKPNRLSATSSRDPRSLSRRFRGLLPVVVDIETSGLNPQQDALLEIAWVFLDQDIQGHLFPRETHNYHVEPFLGSHLSKESLEINRIDPENPLRLAIPETQALYRIFATVNDELARTHCYRAVLVGHNAWFDLNFLMSAVKRTAVMPQPFHTFTTFDTATLAGITLGETVLARATKRAKIPFHMDQAHSAIYDVEKTAELFCRMVNNLKT